MEPDLFCEYCGEEFSWIPQCFCEVFGGHLDPTCMECCEELKREDEE